MDLPPPVQRFIETTNHGDSDGFLACFASDAVLTDGGREYRGADGIAEWNGTDNIGAKARFEVLEGKPTGRGYAVVLRVSSSNFNGEGTVLFQLEGDRIAGVLIE
jgi:hypothetical protein